MKIPAMAAERDILCHEEFNAYPAHRHGGARRFAGGAFAPRLQS
jgi:hypothetical protein